jgi:hypothetical protein
MKKSEARSEEPSVVQVNIKAAPGSSDFALFACCAVEGVRSAEFVFPDEEDEELKRCIVAEVAQDELDRVLRAFGAFRSVESFEVNQPRRVTGEQKPAATTEEPKRSSTEVWRDLLGKKPAAPKSETPKTSTDKERGIKTFYNVRTLFKLPALEWEVALFDNFFVDSRGVYYSGAAEKIRKIRGRVLLEESSALDAMRILMRTGVSFKVEPVYVEDGTPYKFTLLSDENSKKLKEAANAQQ